MGELDFPALDSKFSAAMVGWDITEAQVHRRILELTPLVDLEHKKRRKPEIDIIVMFDYCRASANPAAQVVTRDTFLKLGNDVYDQLLISDHHKSFILCQIPLPKGLYSNELFLSTFVHSRMPLRHATDGQSESDVPVHMSCACVNVARMPFL
jgi:hypothetical protein